MSNYKKFGQYFTTNKLLQNIVIKLIKNKPKLILEPSVGRGDLVKAISNKYKNIKFNCYEIDKTIDFIIPKSKIKIQDFLKANIKTKYDTIVGNPPYVKTESGNLYIDFIDKSYDLLKNNGEMIMIIPSDFFKLTSAKNTLNKLYENGKITDIYHPHEENLFDKASIDVIIFRYQKNIKNNNIVNYNGKKHYLYNDDGVLVITKTKRDKNCFKVNEKFTVHVGMITGLDSVFKNEKLGNVKLIINKNKYAKFILIDKYPSKNKKINNYLLKYKKELLNRKIRKFNSDNWFEWGALRNIPIINKYYGKPCIYVKTITRDNVVAFIGKVQLFSANLLMMIPKKKTNLDKIIKQINSKKFRDSYIYAGRFKIGQRQLALAYIC